MQCESCGSVNAGSSAFCGSCGGRLIISATEKSDVKLVPLVSWILGAIGVFSFGAANFLFTTFFSHSRIAWYLSGFGAILVGIALITSAGASSKKIGIGSLILSTIGSFVLGGTQLVAGVFWNSYPTSYNVAFVGFALGFASYAVAISLFAITRKK